MNGCKHYRPDNAPDCFEYPDAPKYCKGVNCYYKQLKEKEEILACFWLDAANLIRKLIWVRDVLQNEKDEGFKAMSKSLDETLNKSTLFKLMDNIGDDDE